MFCVSSALVILCLWYKNVLCVHCSCVFVSLVQKLLCVCFALCFCVFSVRFQKILVSPLSLCFCVFLKKKDKFYFALCFCVFCVFSSKSVPVFAFFFAKKIIMKGGLLFCGSPLEYQYAYLLEPMF